MTDEILKRLDALASKLGITVAYLWGVLVKQARVEAIQDVGIVAIWVVLTGLSFWAARWIYKDETEKDCGGLIVFLGCVCLGSLALTLYFVFAAITEVMNPEYWALKQVVTIMK